MPFFLQKKERERPIAQIQDAGDGHQHPVFVDLAERRLTNHSYMLYFL